MARRRGGARALLGNASVGRAIAEEERRLLEDVRGRLRDAALNSLVEDSAHVSENDTPSPTYETKTEKEQNSGQLLPNAQTQLVGGADSSSETTLTINNDFETIFSDLKDSLRNLSMDCQATEAVNVEERLDLEALVENTNVVSYPGETDFRCSEGKKNWNVRDPYYMEGLPYADEVKIHTSDQQLFAVRDPFEPGGPCMSVMHIKDPFT